MTTEACAALIKQLDGRFRELGIFCNHIPQFNIKAMLRGEMMMIVQDSNWPWRPAVISWFPATEKPLESIYEPKDH